jgi:hypothetical protein
MRKHIKYLQTRVRQLLRFALAVSSVCVRACRVWFVCRLALSVAFTSQFYRMPLSHRTFSAWHFTPYVAGNHPLVSPRKVLGARGDIGPVARATGN